MSLPRYPEYKDSGVAWLGEVPRHWKVTQLKRVVDPARSITYGIVQAGANVEDGIPYIRPADMSDECGILDETNLLKTSIEIATSYVRSTIKQGDLVCSIGPSFGKLMVVPHTLDGANLTQGTARVAVSAENSSKYVFWSLRSVTSFSQWESSVGGATFRALNLGPLAETYISAPLLEEQQAIAAFLDRETGKIDALIAEQRRLAELLAEKRQAVISHAVTKGLNPNARMKDSDIEWLGEVPAHWEIGGLTRFIGPVVDYRGRTPTKVDEGIFLVTARNVRGGKIDYDASQEFVDPESAASLLARGEPEIGDLLFTMEAPLGQVALIDRTDIALAQRIVKFRGMPKVMQNNFLLYWFMSAHCQARLETLATGSTALGIKASKLGMIECLVPPLDEQTTIANYIDRETAKLDTLTAEANCAIALLQERRSALISAAVTGKIDVRTLAPSSQAGVGDVLEAA
ncbi:type-1 restriction enzyme EcoKI specificity protein [mine drainage metagenome]|uniref:Type-1 restriction enzyme EcoKI specificity protein n=1 Tax=mine drainage metagenome TaxID=410659 RepID=A0A1J5TA04_9ZZZZ